MEDNELEEGEACDDQDSGCDPDTAFSYIDEKLRVVLGDVQKEFEGGVSAEKLGSKFGGYGSFLPTHERAPSLLLQQKASSVLTNDAPRSKKSPSEGIVEKMKRMAAVSSVGLVNDKVCAGPGCLSSDDGSRDLGPVNEKNNNADSTLAALKTDESVGHQKKVTLIIKMGSDADMRKRKTAIYSGLGLDDSSSASLDDDEDDQISDSELESSPDRTPLTMIRIMTSHQLPEGVLLSPLPDLFSEPFVYKDQVRSALREGQKMRSVVPSKGDSACEFGITKIEMEAEKLEKYKERFRENVSEWKDENEPGLDHGKKVKKEKEDLDKRSSRESGRSISKLPTRAEGKEVSKLSDSVIERHERDAVSESGKGGRLHEISREVRGSFRDKGFSECTMEDVENVPKDIGSPFESLKEVESSRESLLKLNKMDRRVPFCQDNLKDQLDVLHQVRDAGKELSTIELDVHGKKQHDANEDLTEGKKRSATKEVNVAHEGKMRVSKDALKQTSKNKGAEKITDISTTDRELGKEAIEAKKTSKDTGKEGYVSKGSAKDKIKEASKEIRKGSGKDTHVKEALSKEMMNEAFREGRRDSLKTVAKDLQKDSAKELLKKETAEPRKKDKPKQGKGGEPPSRDLSRLIERDRERDQAVQRDVSMKTANLSMPNHRYSEATCPDQQLVPGALPGLPMVNGAPNLPGLPTVNGVPTPTVTAPVLIHENWVACDKCEKWRLLPPGIQPEQLPKKWRCKMLDWLRPGMNHCRFTEEDTTQALYNLLGIPQPPSQVQVDSLAGQVQPPAGVTAAFSGQVQPPAGVTAVFSGQVQPPAGVPAALPNNVNLGTQNQEVGVPKLTKSTSGKKRKAPSTLSNEHVSTKNKSLNDVVQMPQEGTQGKLGSDDSGCAQVMEDKRRVKDKEKLKRLRASDGASPVGRDVMREAQDLKHRADRLKGKEGTERESTDLYLRAALKFLHAAAKLEPIYVEGAELGEYTKSMMVYTDTAKLCEFCAVIYERMKEMAAAALAYKCAGLAHMRVVLAKNTCTIRDRTELQAAYQQVPPGESPCSSIASDVDNLIGPIDRLPVKGAASPSLSAQSGGNYVMPARCRPRYNRILQFVEDIHAAMEALSKSQHAFKVAMEALSKSQHAFNVAKVGSPSASITVEGMLAVRRVVDFGFHNNVESSLHLVRLALEAIGH